MSHSKGQRAMAREKDPGYMPLRGWPAVDRLTDSERVRLARQQMRGDVMARQLLYEAAIRARDASQTATVK
jgi:hypothetical protein